MIIPVYHITDMGDLLIVLGAIGAVLTVIIGIVEAYRGYKNK